MTKFIFLDIDGVLNYAGCAANCGPYLGVSDNCVRRLAKIVKETDAKIILTSTWREHWFKTEKEEQGYLADYLDRKLRREGLYIYDKTKDLGLDHRGAEIEEYLHRFPADKWAILDDEFFSDFGITAVTGHLVSTNHDVGLTDKNVDDAISLLDFTRTRERLPDYEPEGFER